MKHIMIDIETLGTAPASVILSIGAVLFDVKDDQYYEEIDHIYLVIDQMGERYPRTILRETLVWWLSNRPDELHNLLVSPARVDLQLALSSLYTWIDNIKGPKCIWATGAWFGILEHAYDQYRVEHPWHYSQIRDYQTMRELFDPKNILMVEEEEDTQPRNALENTRYQAKRLACIFAELRDIAFI